MAGSCEGCSIGKDVMPVQYPDSLAKARRPEWISLDQRPGSGRIINGDDPCAACALVAFKERPGGLNLVGMPGQKFQMVGHLFGADVIVVRRVFEQDEVRHFRLRSCHLQTAPARI